MTLTRFFQNAVGCLFVFGLSASAQDQIAYWNFNGQNLFIDNVAIGADVTNSNVTGSPTLKMLNQTINLNGVSGEGYTDIDDVNHVGGKAPSWADIKGSGPDATILLALSTTNWESLSLRFDYKSQLADSYDIAVSINEGDSWHKLTNNTPLTADYVNWHSETIDLSALAMSNSEEGLIVIENRENLWIRIDDLVQNGNDAFDFDNVEIRGHFNSNQSPIVEFVNDDQLVSEGAGVVNVALSLENPNSQDVVVEVLLNNPATSATVSDDFTTEGAFPLTVTFPAGSSANQTIPITIVDDALAEGTENIVLEIGDVSNGQMDSESEHEIRVADNDSEIPSLFINEVMSKNTATIADENGEYDDWIEIYNPNLFEVDLADYIMKDGVDTYVFPAGSESTKISPSNFILIWADGQSSQGPLHTKFKLSSTGEFVGLYAPDGTTEIDGVTVPELLDDKSYGRSVDGGSSWVVFEPENVSPKASNGGLSVNEFELDNTQVYPNPVTDGMLYFSAPMKVQIFTLLGQELIGSTEAVTQLDVSQLEMGVYLIRSENGGTKKVLIK